MRRKEDAMSLRRTAGGLSNHARTIPAAGLLAMSLITLSFAKAGTATADLRSVRSAQIQVHPIFGPAGTLIHVRGSGFPPLGCPGFVDFTDAVGTVTTIGSFGAMKF